MRPVPVHAEQTLPPSNVDAVVGREREALEQQRTEFICALAAAEQSLKTFLRGSLEHGKARARMTRLQNEPRVIRGRLGAAKKRQSLGDILVEVCRERATSAEWQRIVADAQQRHDEQGALKDSGALRSARPVEHG